MNDDERTMYVNGEEKKPVATGKDESTVYVGRHQAEQASTQESTVYVRIENDANNAALSSIAESEVSKIDVSPLTGNKSSIADEKSVETPPAENESSSESSNQEPVDLENGTEGVSVSYYLPINTMLQRRYRIDSVIGEGGFGITYSGWDITLDIPVAIKEYYPNGMVTRNATLGKTTQVVPVSQAKYGNQFRDGIDRVLDEARRTAKFRNTPGIVTIYDFFEANNTAYIVMEYIDGCTLDEYYKNHRVDNTTLFNMLVPIMDALQALHKEGIIHRDISPDNIMVDKDGNYKLLDFGAARGFSEDSSTTMSIILKKSYAPEEQFRSKGNQGPWTDVYALGATIYDLITGHTPPSSIDRLAEDDIVDIRKIAPSLTKGQAAAIMRALSVRSKDRWQTMEEFKVSLLQATDSTQINDNKIGETPQSGNNRARGGKEKILVTAIVIALSIFLLIVIVFFIRSMKDDNITQSSRSNDGVEDNSGFHDMPVLSDIEDVQNEQLEENENLLGTENSDDLNSHNKETIVDQWGNSDQENDESSSGRIFVSLIGVSVKYDSIYVNLNIENLSDKAISVIIDDRHDINGVSCPTYGIISYNRNIPSKKSTQVEMKFHNKEILGAIKDSIDTLDIYMTVEHNRVVAHLSPIGEALGDAFEISTIQMKTECDKVKVYLTYVSAGKYFLGVNYLVENISEQDISISVAKNQYLNEVSYELYGKAEYKKTISSGCGTVVNMSFEGSDLMGNIGDTLDSIDLQFAVDGTEYSASFSPLQFPLNGVYGSGNATMITSENKPELEKQEQGSSADPKETYVIDSNGIMSGPNDVLVELKNINEKTSSIYFHFSVTNNSSETQRLSVPLSGNFFDDLEVETHGATNYKEIPPGKTVPIEVYVLKSGFTNMGVNSVNNAEIRMRVKKGKSGEEQNYQEFIFPINEIKISF